MEFCRKESLICFSSNQTSYDDGIGVEISTSRSYLAAAANDKQQLEEQIFIHKHSDN